MLAIAADIGGTNSRIALVEDGADAPAIYRFANAAFPSLEAVIAEACRQHGRDGAALSAMVLALPGPVHRDPVRLTNIDWEISRATLGRRFGAQHLLLVNDFQAAAVGVLTVPASARVSLNPVAADAGPVVVAGAGTGLGMAWLPRADHAGLPHATEGGRMDFGPGNAQEVRLLAWLADRHGHVSYERIVSGQGLVDVDHFLRGRTDPSLTAPDVVAAARSGDAVASDAIGLFIDVYAAYAGNLALAFQPTGGILLCGGVTTHLADWFEPERVRRRYSDKGRLGEAAARIPLALVPGHDAGLDGAVRLLDRLTRADA
jgi:glucokinase